MKDFPNNHTFPKLIQKYSLNSHLGPFRSGVTTIFDKKTPKVKSHNKMFSSSYLSFKKNSFGNVFTVKWKLLISNNPVIQENNQP